MKKLFLLMLILGIGCTPKDPQVMHSSNNNPYAKKVDSLLALMTLEEKIGQMNQYNGFWDVTGPSPNEGDAAKKYDNLRKGWVGSMLNVRGVAEVRKVQKIAVEESRLGIPLIFGYDVIHGYKTISPIPLAETASWDLEAIQNSAQVAATEAAAAGINWTFAPMVDVTRDARWGRVMEGAGEDPYLGSLVAKARVKGFQGDDLSATNTIAACAKHFAGYGFSEAGKDYNTVDIGTNTLYNMVFPPFEACVEADVKTFMNSFNQLNGVPATGNPFLQRDILKELWDFQGFVVSDWGSIGEMISHGFASDGSEAARLAVLAGSDMDMESYLYIKHLKDLVDSKAVSESLIDDAVRRILLVKYELGLFEDPYRYCDEVLEATVIDSKAHHETVLDMAKKSIVLLKNDRQMLPLAKDGQKIALIGALAADKDSPLGSWRIAGEANTAVSVLEGLQVYTGNKLTYAKGADVTVGETSFVMESKINTSDTSGFAEAIKAARNADKVVLVLGENGFQTGEGRSRTRLDLPGVQQQLLEAVFNVNPNVILVLNNGRPLAIPWAAEHIPAIVEAWQLGSEAGHAIAQVLYGDYNPSGKLPMSFPRNVGQVPIYYNHQMTGRNTEPVPGLVFWTHYSDEANTPLFPFGHGLSYTTFEYSPITLLDDFASKGSITLQTTVTNIGNYDGKEIVQLYIHDLFGSVARPVKELKGMQLIALPKGVSKTVTFQLTHKELGYYTNEGKWLVEKGAFDFYVGGSSATTNKITYELK